METKQFTERPNLNELAKEIYEANKVKGFHDKEYSNEHYLCLVISELMEAVEADRNGERANIDTYNLNINSKEYIEHLDFGSIFIVCIKDTLEDELADAIIRLLDLAGLRGWDIKPLEIFCMSNIDGYRSLTENIFEIVHLISDSHLTVKKIIESTIKDIESMAQHFYQIDIWQHVDLKIKYNATRDFKHDKKY